MAAEPIHYEAGSTYDVPTGPAWHLTCPACGWQAGVDQTGTPFWPKGELQRGRSQDPLSGEWEGDVDAGSRDEAERRLRFMQQLRGNAAAHRGWSGPRKDKDLHHGVTEDTEDGGGHGERPAPITKHLGLEGDFDG